MSTHPSAAAAQGCAENDAPPQAGPQLIEVGANVSGSDVWHAYRAFIAGLFEASLPDGSSAESFHLRSATWQGIHVSLRRSQGSAQILRRGPELIAHGADQIMLYAQIRGRVDHRCGDLSERIEPGDVTIYNSKRPIESRSSDFENLILMLDRDVAPLPLLADQAHGKRLPGGSGIADLIVAGMLSLETNARTLSIGAFETAALALASVAAEPVRADVEGAKAANTNSPVASRLRARAIAYIDANLANRSLTPQAMAAELGLSRSALYRLFEPYGGVRHVILSRRLDRAVQTLLEDPNSHRALGEVARRHGFPALAHFSRLFSARFGMPPSHYCALVQAGGTEWLASQYGRTRFSSDLPGAWQGLGARRL